MHDLVAAHAACGSIVLLLILRVAAGGEGRFQPGGIKLFGLRTVCFEYLCRLLLGVSIQLRQDHVAEADGVLARCLRGVILAVGKIAGQRYTLPAYGYSPPLKIGEGVRKTGDVPKVHSVFCISGGVICWVIYISRIQLIFSNSAALARQTRAGYLPCGVRGGALALP